AGPCCPMAAVEDKISLVRYDALCSTLTLFSLSGVRSNHLSYRPAPPPYPAPLHDATTPRRKRGSTPLSYNLASWRRMTVLTPSPGAVPVPSSAGTRRLPRRRTRRPGRRTRRDRPDPPLQARPLPARRRSPRPGPCPLRSLRTALRRDCRRDA